MKSRKVILIIAGVFVVLALGVMLLFVFSGSDPETEEVSFAMEGTWKVAAYAAGGSVTLPEEEYFVFTGDSASAYRNGESEPYVTSSYEQIGYSAYADMELNLPELSRNYVVSICTDNYLCLREGESVFTQLIRCADDEMTTVSFEEDIVEGHWVVAYRNTTEVMEEEITFENGMLYDYRNGSAEPVATVPYYWNEAGHICVDALGVEMVCYPMTEDIIFFVEVATGYVWELNAAE